MTVREALRDLLYVAAGPVYPSGAEVAPGASEIRTGLLATRLAPHVETFGRACYYAGIDEKGRPNSDLGIAAGVKAMMERS